MCIETRLSISAMLAAAQMARLSWRTVNGSMGSSPGNSHPLVRIFPWAWAVRHQLRSRSSSKGESIA